MTSPATSLHDNVRPPSTLTTVNTSSVITYQNSSPQFGTNSPIQQLQRWEQGQNTTPLDTSQVHLIQFKQEQIDPPRLLSENAVSTNTVHIASHSDA